MKQPMKRLTALILAMSMSLSLLSTNVWAADFVEAAQNASAESAPVETPADTSAETSAESSEESSSEESSAESSDAPQAVAEAPTAEKSEEALEESEEETTAEESPAKAKAKAESTESVEIRTSDNSVRVGDWEYFLCDDDSDTACISHYYGKETEITIPSEIDGYRVTSLDSWMFGQNTSIKEVTIPDSITTLGYGVFNECSALESVVLPNGITTLPYLLFNGCLNLKDVSLPENLKLIGESAFSGCSSLESVTIPEGVTKIGYDAFSHCSALKSIQLPETLSSIGEWAFCNCPALESVVVPKGVTSIGDYAFADCENLTLYGFVGSAAHSYANGYGIPFVASFDLEGKLEAETSLDVEIESGTKYFLFTPTEDGFYIISSEGNYDTYGYLYTSEGSQLAYDDDSGNNSNFRIKYELEAGKTYIVGVKQYEGGYAQFTLSVTKMKDYDYYISGNKAVFTHYNSNAESFEVPAEIEGYPVSKIDYGAFSGCSTLKSVVIPERVTQIGDSAFSHCSALESVTIPEGVTQIGYDAFSNCSALKSVQLPETLSSIGEWAFCNCPALESVTIPDSVTSIGYSAFRDCTSLERITIPQNVSRIESYTFSNCSKLKNVTIPDNVTFIGYSAFSNCSALKSISLPKGLSSISSCMFFECSSLESVTIPDSVTSIGGAAFSNCSALEIVTIPKGVTQIGEEAFKDCSKLEEITIPTSVTSIGGDAFTGTPWLAKQGDCLILNGILVKYMGEATQFTIPDGVTKIAASAFANCATLTSVTIPDSVTSIGVSAFRGCTSLESVTIPASVKKLNNYTFADCTSLTSATIPKTVTSISYNAFNNCKNLTIYGEINSKAEDFAVSHQIPFVASNEDKRVVLTLDEPVKVTYNTARIWLTFTPSEDGTYTFSSTGSKDTFAELYAADRETLLADNDDSGERNNFSFSYELQANTLYYLAVRCYSSTGSFAVVVSKPASGFNYSVTPEGVVITSYTGTDAELTIPATIDDTPVVGIASNAFSNNKTLTSVTIPEGVKWVEEYTFSGCTALEKVNLPSTLREVAPNAFSDTAWYAAQKNNEFVISGGYLLKYNGDAESVTIPEGVTTIGYRAFYAKRSLKGITIPDTVTRIGESAFYYCTSLESITIPQNTELDNYAFGKCKKLSGVTYREMDRDTISRTFIHTPYYKQWIRQNDTSYARLYDAYNNVTFYDTLPTAELTVPYGSTLYITKKALQGWLSDAGKDFSLEMGWGSRLRYLDDQSGILATLGVQDKTVKVINLIGGKNAWLTNKSMVSLNFYEHKFVVNWGDAVANRDVTLSRVLAMLSGNPTVTLGIYDGSLTIKGNNSIAYSNVNVEGDGTLSIEKGTYGFDITPYVAAGHKAEKNSNGTWTVVEGEATDLPDSGNSDFVISGTKLVSYKGDGSNEVVIPEGVTEIGKFAFTDHYEITSVIIPDTVTTIGEDAFRYCENLVSVNLPESVTTIGQYAFYSCSSLRTISIPEGVKTIPESAFSYCNALTEIVLPAGLESIEGEAFCSCSSLPSIEIPNTIKTIEENVFSACYNLTEIVIPDSVETIRDYAFWGCSNLEKVTVPASVSYISRLAFEGTPWMNAQLANADEFVIVGKTLLAYNGTATEVVIPDGVESISDIAFRGNTTLTSVTIPSSVKTIGDSAFQGCDSLTNVTIPDSVTEIGYKAFYYCINLQSVKLPSGVDLNRDVFGKCRKLETVDCAGLTPSVAYSALGSTPFYKQWITKNDTSYARYYYYNEDGKDVDFYDTLPTGSLTLYSGEYLYVTKKALMGWMSDAGKDFTLTVKSGAHLCYVDEETSLLSTLGLTESTVKTMEIIAPSHAWLNTCGDVTIRFNERMLVVNGLATANKSVSLNRVIKLLTGNPLITINIEKSSMLEVNGDNDIDYSNVKVVGQGKLKITKGTYGFDVTKYVPDGIKVEQYDNGNYCVGDSHTHNYVETITTVASCTTAGVKTFTCSVCGKTETETIPATGHTEQAVKGKAATCTEAGLTDGAKCSVCGAITKEQEKVAALGHSWNDGTVTKAVTCTEKGTKTYTCTRCNTTKTDGIPAKGHTEEIIKDKAATCTEAGLTDGAKCSVCGAITKEQEVVAALGHSWNDGTVTQAATCTEKGTKTYTCTRCNTTKTDGIPATGHNSGDVPAVDATCTEAGLTAGKQCSVCGAITEKQEKAEALGHSWNDGTVTQAATCTEKGTKTYTCTRCNTTKTDGIPATGHILTEIPAKAATTTATGNNLYYQCSECEKYFKADRLTETTPKAESIAKLVVKLKANTITASNKTLTAKATGTQTVNLNATVKDKAKLTYKSNNKSITVDSKGKVTVKKGYAGKATITISAAATKNYAVATKKVTVTVNKAKQPMVVTPTAKTYKLANVKKKAQTLTLKVTKAQGAVTYKSSNSKYVTVSKGKVTIKKGAPKGKYTITVTAAGKGIYSKGSKKITITVK